MLRAVVLMLLGGLVAALIAGAMYGCGVLEAPEIESGGGQERPPHELRLRA